MVGGNLMKNLGVIFGGVTCEHDVSIVTGLQLIENVDKKKYNIIPIYIHSDGNWYTGEKLLDAKTIVVKEKGHISAEDGVFELEEILDECNKMIR